jgi:hypothetical protein
MPNHKIQSQIQKINTKSQKTMPAHSNICQITKIDATPTEKECQIIKSPNQITKINAKSKQINAQTFKSMRNHKCRRQINMNPKSIKIKAETSNIHAK